MAHSGLRGALEVGRIRVGTSHARRWGEWCSNFVLRRSETAYVILPRRSSCLRWNGGELAAGCALAGERSGCLRNRRAVTGCKRKRRGPFCSFLFLVDARVPVRQELSCACVEPAADSDVMQNGLPPLLRASAARKADAIGRKLGSSTWRPRPTWNLLDAREGLHPSGSLRVSKRGRRTVGIHFWRRHGGISGGFSDIG